MSEANKPAFPVLDAHLEEGLTKREYYAAKAMQGILPEMLRRVDAYNHHGGLVDADGVGESVRLAQIAADAMLYETERHNDMLALVERVAVITEEVITLPRIQELQREALRILGRGE